MRWVLAVVLGVGCALAIDAACLEAGLSASRANVDAGLATVQWRLERGAEGGGAEDVLSTIVWNGPLFRQEDEHISAGGGSTTQVRLYDGRRAIDVSYGGTVSSVLVQEFSRPRPAVQSLGRLLEEEAEGATLSVLEEHDDGTCVALLEAGDSKVKLWVDTGSGFLVSRKEFWLDSADFPLRVVTTGDFAVDPAGVWYPRSFADESYAPADDGSPELLLRLSGTITSFSTASSVDIDRSLVLAPGSVVNDVRVKPAPTWRVQAWW